MYKEMEQGKISKTSLFPSGRLSPGLQLEPMLTVLGILQQPQHKQLMMRDQIGHLQ